MSKKGSTYPHETCHHYIHQDDPVEIPIKYRKTWRKKYQGVSEDLEFVFEGYDLTTIRLSFGFDVLSGNTLSSIVSTD